MSGKAWRRKVAKKSQEPEFVEWLQGMETKVDEFLNTHAPDGFPGESPFSVDAVRLISEDLHQRFPTYPKLRENPVHADYLDGLIRYIGQFWVVNFEGRWVNLPRADDLADEWEIGPAVVLPFFELYANPHEDIRRIIRLDKPELIPRINRNM